MMVLIGRRTVAPRGRFAGVPSEVPLSRRQPGPLRTIGSHSLVLSFRVLAWAVGWLPPWLWHGFARVVVVLAGLIKRQVADRFGIWLRAEPAFVGFGDDPEVAFLKEAGG